MAEQKYWLITIRFLGHEFNTVLWSHEVIKVSPAQRVLELLEFKDGEYIITMATEITEEEHYQLEGVVG